MNPFIKKIARPVYHKSQDNSLGKRSIILAFTMRQLTRKFGDVTIIKKASEVLL